MMLCSQRSKLVPGRLAAVVKQQGQVHVNLHIHVSISINNYATMSAMS